MLGNRKASLFLLAILLASLLPAGAASAARDTGPVVLVDLSHGEATSGLDTLFKIMPEFQWVVLVASEDDVANLPDTVKLLAKEIWVGSFADVADMLGLVDGIIVGQPAAEFTPDEIAVLTEWFYSDSNRVKFIWLAGDSDYPAQGGNLEIAQSTINAILESLGAQLRHDYVSVEDPVNYAKKTYRVVGTVEPDEPLGFLAVGAQAVLFHGPGALAYVDENGEWRSLSEGAPEGVFRIIWTSDQAYIVEHQPAQPGAPGNLGMAYAAGDTGRFVLMAAETMLVPIEDSQVPRIILLSSETPYGGYQPMITYLYKGIPLDGPRFVRNVLLWASGVMAELKAFTDMYLGVQASLEELNGVNAKVSELGQKLSEVSNALQNVQNSVAALQQELEGLKQASGEVENLKTTIGELQNALSQLNQALQQLEATVGDQDGKISDLRNQLDQLSQQLDQLKNQVEEVKAAAEKAPSSTTAMAGAVLGLLAIILAAVALTRK